MEPSCTNLSLPRFASIRHGFELKARAPKAPKSTKKDEPLPSNLSLISLRLRSLVRRGSERLLVFCEHGSRISDQRKPPCACPCSAILFPSGEYDKSSGNKQERDCS
jgi:hypothetical protein